MASNDAEDDTLIDTVPKIDLLHTLILEKPPCCLEFAPLAPEYFVVGTYNLVKDDEPKQENDGQSEDDKSKVIDEGEARKQTRDGSLILCKVVKNEIKIIQTQPTAFGVLDIHFSPKHKSIFAVAASTGLVAFYQLQTQKNTSTYPRIVHIDSIQLVEQDIIVTSLAWNGAIPNQLAITLTNGDVGTLHVPSWVLEGVSSSPRPHSELQQTTDDDSNLNVLFIHSLEAWTTSILPPTWPYIGLLSGGDDAVLSYSPLPSPNDDPHNDSIQPPQPAAWTNRRIHSAGVTAILPLTLPIQVTEGDNPHNYILTGSYDDHLRILSPPSPGQKQPQVLHERNLGGGVWRVKLIEQDMKSVEDGMEWKGALLISCMYAGAKIVEVNAVFGGDGDGQGEWSSKVLAEFVGHESMCYACDVQPALPDETAVEEQVVGDDGGAREKTIVSCSFYDKRLCLWKWNHG